MDPAATNDAKAKERPLRTPAYRLHKPSGKAIVTLNGRMFYLGRFDSPESRVAYNRLLGEWEARGRTPPPVACAGGEITIKELLALYKAHAKDYYRNSPGTVANVNQAVKILEDTYPSLPAAEFGPRLLKALRATMIKNEWSRPLVNARIESIRRAFGWAVCEELLPASVHEALRTVEGLRRGRSDAREPEPMQPVAWAHVEPVLAELMPTLRSRVEFMWWTGMRTGELVTMKPQEIDRTGPVWLYRPPTHKNAWRGKGREIPMGPRAQEILKPLLDRVPAPSAEKPVFSPQRSELERSLARRLKRRNGVTPSQARRRKLPLEERQEPPREGYDPNTYGLAVRRGIEAANGVTAHDPTCLTGPVVRLA